MCELVSWTEHQRDGKTIVLCLDDEVLSSARGKQFLRDCKDNDILGHHANRAYYGKDGVPLAGGVNRELRNFWLTSELPAVLQPKLKDFESFRKHFGSMVKNHAQPDDLVYILENSPDESKPENLRWQGLKRFCREILVERIEPRVKELLANVTTEEFDLAVDYGAKLEDLVKQGQYGYANPDFTAKNFPKDKHKRGKVQKKAKLVCLHQDAQSYEIDAVIERLKLRSGDAYELATFGVVHPEEQRKSPIVGFGSGWAGAGGRRVPYLSEWSGGRGLRLDGRAGRWRGFYRFLVFCE